MKVGSQYTYYNDIIIGLASYMMEGVSTTVRASVMQSSLSTFRGRTASQTVLNVGGRCRRDVTMPFSFTNEAAKSKFW